MGYSRTKIIEEHRGISLVSRRQVVCIDLRCLQIGHENRGIGMHARSVLENLTPRQGVEYILYAFSKNDPIKRLGIKPQITYELLQTPTLKTSISRPRDILHLLRLVTHRFTPLKSLDIDMFIQFDFMLGTPRFRNTKKIVIAYDLIPLILRSTYMPSPLQAYRTTSGWLQKTKKVLRAIYYRWRYHIHYNEYRRADKIISISDDTKRSLENHLGIDSGKIHTIPLAPVFSGERKPDKSIISRIKKPYLFYIGATDDRKRVQDLVAAYNIARGRGLDINLVLAGGEFAKVNKIPNQHIKESILNSSYREGIYNLGYVTDDQKLALYRNALAFVFPTIYEGFGLPILEAMEQRCPVISYNNSSIPEVTDDAALLVENYNISALYKAIEALHNNRVLRDKLISKGSEQARKFTWKQYIIEFEAILLKER